MAEALSITVHPSAQGSDDLTVADAMRQVLDIIELIEKADEADGGDVRVIWLLKHASTNSPFTIRAESSSNDPIIAVSMRASHARRTFHSGISALLENGVPPEWMDQSSLKIVKRVFERNLSGVGRTDINLGEDGDFLISPSIAQKGMLSVEKALIENKFAFENLTRTEYGSIEGEMIAATRYYQRPAIIIRERLSEERLNCVLSDEAAITIGPEHSWTDVWSGSRVLVSGALHYDANGALSRIDADQISKIEEIEVSLQDLRNMDITGGLDPVEFLKLIREQNNG